MKPRTFRRIRHQDIDCRTIDAAMRRAVTYPHPAGRIRRIETHISTIYLAGRHAYKVNKPVNLGFADFTNLEARQQSCANEVRLARSLAKRLYLGVAPIIRRGRVAQFGDAARAIGYAVHMRRFNDGALFSDLVDSGRLEPSAVHNVADRLAEFHRSASHHAPRHEYGSAALLMTQFEDVCRELELAGVAIPSSVLTWCRSEAVQLANHFEERRRQGFIRECHGDLHLGNVVQQGRNVLVFDCIAFSESLRWIDVINDVAFLAMDLQASGRCDLAFCFLNQWLVQTGDDAGLRALRFYIVYRSLVRTLVESLKPDDGSSRRVHRYLDCAVKAIAAPSPELLLCHGFSGSGKSAASEQLAPLLGALRISSDTERKRHGVLQPASKEKLSAAAYTHTAIDASYDRLYSLAAAAISSGYTVIVDATFLRAKHRQKFFKLFSLASVAVRLLDFHAAPESLAARIEMRATAPGILTDADCQVLVRQLANEDPLMPEELTRTLSFDTDVPLAAFRERTYWKQLLNPLPAALNAINETSGPNRLECATNA